MRFVYVNMCCIHGGRLEPWKVSLLTQAVQDWKSFSEEMHKMSFRGLSKQTWIFPMQARCTFCISYSMSNSLLALSSGKKTAAQLASISSPNRNACSVLSIAHDFGSGNCEGTRCVRSNLGNLHAGHWGSKKIRTQNQSAGKTVQIQTTQDSEACKQNSRVCSQELLASRDH